MFRRSSTGRVWRALGEVGVVEMVMLLGDALLDSLLVGEVSLIEECLSSLLRRMLWEAASSGWLLVGMVPFVGGCFSILLTRVRGRDGFDVAVDAELSMDGLRFDWLSLVSIWILDESLAFRVRVETIEDS